MWFTTKTYCTEIDFRCTCQGLSESLKPASRKKESRSGAELGGSDALCTRRPRTATPRATRKRLRRSKQVIRINLRRWEPAAIPSNISRFSILTTALAGAPLYFCQKLSGTASHIRGRHTNAGLPVGRFTESPRTTAFVTVRTIKVSESLQHCSMWLPERPALLDYKQNRGVAEV